MRLQPGSKWGVSFCAQIRIGHLAGQMVERQLAHGLLALGGPAHEDGEKDSNSM